MTFRRLWFFSSVTLVSAGLLMATAGAGASAGVGAYSVSADSYTIGSITTNPGTTYIGDKFTMTGAGQLANAALEVAMGGETDTDVYMAILGTATADMYGNWSLEATVPSTVIRESDKAEVPTLYGTWTVAGVTVGPDGGLYGSLGSLTVIEYIPANTTTSNTTRYTAAILPNTGVPPAGLWLTGTGLLAGAGLAFERWRVRRQH